MYTTIPSLSLLHTNSRGQKRSGSRRQRTCPPRPGRTGTRSARTRGTAAGAPSPVDTSYQSIFHRFRGGLIVEAPSLRSQGSQTFKLQVGFGAGRSRATHSNGQVPILLIFRSAVHYVGCINCIHPTKFHVPKTTILVVSQTGCPHDL